MPQIELFLRFAFAFTSEWDEYLDYSNRNTVVIDIALVSKRSLSSGISFHFCFNILFFTCLDVCVAVEYIEGKETNVTSTTNSVLISSSLSHSISFALFLELGCCGFV